MPYSQAGTETGSITTGISRRFQTDDEKWNPHAHDDGSSQFSAA
jgi:hypothetical protein